MLPAAVLPALVALVPVLGTWDPRSLWLNLADRVFVVEGTFTPRAAAAVEPAVAVPLLLAMAVAVLAVGYLASLRAPRLPSGRT